MNTNEKAQDRRLVLDANSRPDALPTFAVVVDQTSAKTLPPPMEAPPSCSRQFLDGRCQISERKNRQAAQCAEGLAGQIRSLIEARASARGRSSPPRLVFSALSEIPRRRSLQRGLLS